MLNNQRASAALDGSQLEQGGENSSLPLADLILGFLRRQYLVIIASTVLALAASLLLLTVAPPTYTAHVKVLVGGSKAPVVQQPSMLDETPVDMETQIEILKSRVVATSVIDQLNLADDPDFGGKGRIQPTLKIIRALLGRTPQPRKIDPIDEHIEEFDKRLSAARVGTSSVIDVSFNSSNAERSAEIANAVASAYINDQLKAKLEVHRTATSWLHDRLQELGQDALNAERSVNELRTKDNIVSADGKLIDEQQVTQLSTRLVAARAHTSEAMARLGRFENLLASNSFDSVSLGTLDAVSIGDTNVQENLSITDPQNNQVINSLRLQYLETARREYEYSARYGADHLVVVNLRATMKSIRHTILDEVRRLAEISKSDFAVAKQRQQEIEKQLAQAIAQSRNTSSAELSIRELETSAKGYRSLYESFLQRYMGSVQQSSFPISEARVISSAVPPEKKSKPNAKLLLAIGMLGGLAFGTTLGFLREMRDRAFRTSAQIEARLHVPCLSVVPLLTPAKAKERSNSTTSQAEKQPDRRTFSKGTGACWAASTMPSSRFAESIRSIRLAIDLDPAKAQSRVVGLTSTLPNEGKSTIAASLAQLLANSGKRTIVVDCDLRNPSLSASFTPDADVGIIDVLLRARSLEDTVWTDVATNLHFLPGKRERKVNTSDVLCTDQTRKLFDQLRKTYDYVIVDLPPLAPIVDVRATAPLIDSFILVVEWGRTAIDVVEHALNTAPTVYDSLLGTVLNKTDMKAMKRYASHYGDYYNDEHYARYGQPTAE